MAPRASRPRPPPRDLVPPPWPPPASPPCPQQPHAPTHPLGTTAAAAQRWGGGEAGVSAGGWRGAGWGAAMPCTTACPIPGQLRCPRVPINPPSPRVRGWGLRGRAGRPALTEVKSCRTGRGQEARVSPAAPAPQPSSARTPPAARTFLVARAGSCCRRWLRTGRSPPAAPCSHSFSTGSSCRRKPSAALPGAPSSRRAPGPGPALTATGLAPTLLPPSSDASLASCSLSSSPGSGCGSGQCQPAGLWPRHSRGSGGLGEGPRSHGHPQAPAWPWEQGEPQEQQGHSPHTRAAARGAPAALLPLLTAALKSVTRIWGGTAPRASAPAGEPWHRATVSGAAVLGGSPPAAPCPWHSARLGLRGRAQGQQRARGTAAADTGLRPSPAASGPPCALLRHPAAIALLPAGPGALARCSRPRCAPTAELGNS